MWCGACASNMVCILLWYGAISDESMCWLLICLQSVWNQNIYNQHDEILISFPTILSLLISATKITYGIIQNEDYDISTIQSCCRICGARRIPRSIAAKIIVADVTAARVDISISFATVALTMYGKLLSSTETHFYYLCYFSVDEWLMLYLCSADEASMANNPSLL